MGRERCEGSGRRRPRDRAGAVSSIGQRRLAGAPSFAVGPAAIPATARTAGSGALAPRAMTTLVAMAALAMAPITVAPVAPAGVLAARVPPATAIVGHGRRRGAAEGMVGDHGQRPLGESLDVAQEGPFLGAAERE